MRIPKIKQYQENSENTTYQVGELCIGKSFYNLDNNKDKVKFIKTIEVLVRSSMEYKELIRYLNSRLGMNYCSFFHNVSKEKYAKANIRIELHHEPFTLFDIVDIVLNKHLDEREDDNQIPSMLAIANEVMELHYDGLVGLLPLSQTVHELVHSGALFVPLQFIDEGFNEFYNRYKKYIDEPLKQMLITKVNLSKEYAEDPDKFISILRKKYIYVINEQYDSIPEMLE